MAKYKVAVIQRYFLDNYLLYLIGLWYTSSGLLTHKEMYQSRILKIKDLAIPNPA